MKNSKEKERDTQDTGNRSSERGSSGRGDSMDSEE